MIVIASHLPSTKNAGGMTTKNVVIAFIQGQTITKVFRQNHVSGVAVISSKRNKGRQTMIEPKWMCEKCGSRFVSLKAPPPLNKGCGGSIVEIEQREGNDR